MVMKNYMEEVVVDELEGVLKSIDGACKCELCREDMVAWTLNRIEPLYVVRNLGRIYSKLEQVKYQQQASITALLTKAAKVVKDNPRH
ncbi:MAG: late competence development ComFB family protein [bacterium]